MQENATVQESSTTRARTLLSPTESAIEQLVRVAMVGAVAAFFDISILWLLVNKAHIWYIYAAAIGYGVGLVICYIFNVIWVFPHRRVTDKRLEFLIFSGIGLIALGLTEFFLYVGVDFLHINMMISKLGTIVIVFFFQFAMRKAILFRR